MISAAAGIGATVGARRQDSFAFVIYEDKVYYSVWPELRDVHSMSVFRGPHSPVVDLIQGIYDLHPHEARLILRHRLWLNYAPTVMCREMIKVTAKRWTMITPEHQPVSSAGTGGTTSPAFHFIQITSEGTWHRWPERPKPKEKNHGSYLDLCDQLAGLTTESDGHFRPKFLRDRAVGALLVSASGDILEAAVNSNHSNKTRHAEVNLIQQFYRRHRTRLPGGSRIYISLQPCRMCAAMIFYSSPLSDGIKVVYRHEDLGRWAQHTCLKGTGAIVKESAL